MHTNFICNIGKHHFVIKGKIIYTNQSVIHTFMIFTLVAESRGESSVNSKDGIALSG